MSIDEEIRRLRLETAREIAADKSLSWWVRRWAKRDIRELSRA